MAFENSQIQKRILADYPLPIAFEFQELLFVIEKGDRLGMYLQLASLYETIVRYLTSITLSIVRTHISEEKLSPEQSELDKYVRAHLSEPTTRNCVEILKLAGRLYKNRQISFMPELAQFLSPSDNFAKVGVCLLEDLLLFQITAEREMQALSSRVKMSYSREYEDNAPLVEELLNELNFLAGYPLIRLVSQNEQKPEIWESQILKSSQSLVGNRVLINSLISQNIQIDGGWDQVPGFLGIYDSRKYTFLSIYPYTLFDSCSQCLEEKRSPFNYDLFLYHASLSNEAIYHGISNTSEQIPHKRLVSLNTIIDYLWPARSEKIQSDIEKLRKNLEINAKELINSLREKYNADLYVHRTKIETSFQEFIQSKQTAFLIVGDSGTGKTNLVFNLATQLLNAKKVVVLQNCATWDAAAVRSGVGRHLNTVLGASPNRGLLENMDDYQETSETPQEVFILLDAINESGDPTTFLKSLENEVLLQLGNHRWIKLIITCRTESWKRLQTVLQNEKFFYRSEGTIVHHLTKFSKDELREAYEKYKWTYRLTTTYEEINQKILEYMQYPLMLRLVAESYSNQNIPVDFTLGDLFHKYDDEKLGLVDNNHPPSETRLFVDYLLNEFIQNKSDRVLWKSLCDSKDIQMRNWAIERWSFGSPYYTLLDMGILLEVTRPDNEVEVRFLYDQYLEFKLSQRLFPRDCIANVNQFCKYLSDALKFPSLYGALKTYLNTRNRGRDRLESDEFLFALTEINDVRLRGLLSDFLITSANFSQYNHAQVLMFIENCFQKGEAAGLLAVLAAHLLNEQEMLVLGMINPYESVRKQATIFSFSLWQTNPELAKEAFVRLGKIVAEQFHLSNILAIPYRWGYCGFKRIFTSQKDLAIRGLEPLLDLSLLMIPLAYLRPEAARVAGSIVSGLIAKIPTTAKWLTNRLLEPYGGKIVLEVLAGNQDSRVEGVFVSSGEMNGSDMLKRWQEKSIRSYAARPKNDPIRDLCARAIIFTDPEQGSLDEDLGDLIFTLAHEYDRFVYLSIVELLMTRVERHYEELFRFAKRLYSQGNTHCQYLALRYFTLCTFLAQELGNCGSGHIDFARKMILDFLSFPEKVVEYNGIQGPITLHAIPYLSHFGFGILYEMHERDHGEFDFVKSFMEQPWPKDKAELKTEVVITGLSQAVTFATALSRPKIGLILETLSRWIRDYMYLTKFEQEQVVCALVAYRSIFPNEVDLYIVDAPTSLKTAIHAAEAPISIPVLSVVGMQAGMPWMHAYVPEFRQAFEKNLIKLARGEGPLDKIAHEAGKEIVNMNILQDLTNALAKAGL